MYHYTNRQDNKKRNDNKQKTQQKYEYVIKKSEQKEEVEKVEQQLNLKSLEEQMTPKEEIEIKVEQKPVQKKIPKLPKIDDQPQLPELKFLKGNKCNFCRSQKGHKFTTCKQFMEVMIRDFDEGYSDYIQRVITEIKLCPKQVQDAMLDMFSNFRHQMRPFGFVSRSTIKQRIDNPSDCSSIGSGSGHVRTMEILRNPVKTLDIPKDIIDGCINFKENPATATCLYCKQKGHRLDTCQIRKQDKQPKQQQQQQYVDYNSDYIKLNQEKPVEFFEADIERDIRQEELKLNVDSVPFEGPRVYESFVSLPKFKEPVAPQIVAENLQQAQMQWRSHPSSWRKPKPLPRLIDLQIPQNLYKTAYPNQHIIPNVELQNDLYFVETKTEHEGPKNIVHVAPKAQTYMTNQTIPIEQVIQPIDALGHWNYPLPNNYIKYVPKQQTLIRKDDQLVYNQRTFKNPAQQTNYAGQIITTQNLKTQSVVIEPQNEWTITNNRKAKSEKSSSSNSSKSLTPIQEIKNRFAAFNEVDIDDNDQGEMRKAMPAKLYEPSRKVDCKKAQKIKSRRIDYADPGNNKFSFNYLVDKNVREHLEHQFPSHELEFSGNKRHNHPILHTTRVIVEDDIYKSYGRKLQYVVDIGGTPQRHVEMQRFNIWSCCPTLDQKDQMRYSSLPRDEDGFMDCDEVATCCAHKVEDCDCFTTQNVELFMAIHSLYYLSPKTVCKLVQRAPLVAAVHSFNQYEQLFGTIPGTNYYEARSQMLPGGLVTMYNTDEYGSYTHSNMAWLYDQCYVDSETGQAMCWQIVRNYKEQVVIKFEKCDKALPVCKQPYSNLTEMLIPDQDNELYYRQLAPNKTSHFDQNVQLPTYSLGSYIGIDNSKINRIIQIPKQFLINLGIHVIGKEKSPANYQLLTNKARQLCKAYPLKCHYDCVTYGPALAMTMNLEAEEIAVDVVRARVHTSNRLGAKLKSFSEMWNSPRRIQIMRRIILGLILLIACIGLGFVSSIIQFGLGVALNVVYETSIYCGPTLVVFILLLILHQRLKPQKPKFYDHYVKEIRQQGFMSRPMEEICQLSKTIVTRCVSTMCPWKEQNPLSTIEIKTEELKRQKLRAGCTAVGLITCHVPVVPNPDLQNEIQSMKNRACCKTLEPTENVFELLKLFVRNNAAFIFGFSEHSEPRDRFPLIPFNLWNKAFPRDRQIIQQKAYDYVTAYIDKNELTEMDIKRFCLRKAFIKREKLLKSNPDIGFEDFDPRTIQGVSAEANVIAGPWIKSLAKHIARKWNVTDKNNRNNKLTYATGFDAKGLGQVYNEIVNGEGIIENPIFVEDDFSRFDSTISSEALDFEFWIYRELFGCPDAVLQILYQQFSTKGYGQQGLKYVVEGTRKSGDPNTSLGNTIINGLTHLFWGAVSHQMVTKGLDFNEALLAAAREDVKQVQFRGAFLGDDVMIKCNKHYQEVNDLADFMQIFGFKAKVVLRKPEDLEFLSGIFPPVEIDGELTHIYVPLPGKAINKLGWSLDYQPDFAAWYKQNMISYSKSFSCVPGMNDLLDNELARFSKAKDIKLNFKNQKELDSRPLLKERVQPSVETVSFFHTRYGVDIGNLYQQVKDKIPKDTRPFIMNTKLLDKIIARDMDQEDSTTERVKSVKNFTKQYNVLQKYGMKLSVDIEKDVYDQPLFNHDAIENRCILQEAKDKITMGEENAEKYSDLETIGINVMDIPSITKEEEAFWGHMAYIAESQQPTKTHPLIRRDKRCRISPRKENALIQANMNVNENFKPENNQTSSFDDLV